MNWRNCLILVKRFLIFLLVIAISRFLLAHTPIGINENSTTKDIASSNVVLNKTKDPTQTVLKNKSVEDKDLVITVPVPSVENEITNNKTKSVIADDVKNLVTLRFSERDFDPTLIIKEQGDLQKLAKNRKLEHRSSVVRFEKKQQKRAKSKNINFNDPLDNFTLIKKFGKYPFKEGVELVSNNKKVHAVKSGIVLYSGDGLVDYKTLVVIKHPDKVISVYGHLKKSFVKAGQIVKVGEVIGTFLNKIYFEMRIFGKQVDPMTFLKGKWLKSHKKA